MLRVSDKSSFETSNSDARVQQCVLERYPQLWGARRHREMLPRDKGGSYATDRNLDQRRREYGAAHFLAQRSRRCGEISNCPVDHRAMANFFFLRADASRNHASPLSTTLLCQLFEICPVIKWRIHDFVAKNFYIFDTSIEQQLRTLMLSALARPGQIWTGRQKIVLIIDGLDECASEKTSAQQDILRALHYIVTQKDSPFILFVTSRAEPHLTRSYPLAFEFLPSHSNISRVS